MSMSMEDKNTNMMSANTEATSSPYEVLNDLLKILNFREKEIIERRHGIGKNDKQTLETIGKYFKITRERVRQIESASIKKLKANKVAQEKVTPIMRSLEDALNQHGGMMHEDHLIDHCVQNCVDEQGEKRDAEKTALYFLLSKLLDKEFAHVKANERHGKAWKRKDFDNTHFDNSHKVILEIINGQDETEPIDTADLYAALTDHDEYNHEITESQLHAYLTLSENVDKDVFGKWGHKDWTSVNPKKTNDKIYIVLKNEGKPLHFKKIAEKINEIAFDHKVAYPATVHNELILDDKYVLIGRGIYALSEWGYKKGVVADVIADILQSSQDPMSRDQIISEVLKQRIVGKTTIQLALMNKNRFKKSPEGKYFLTS